MSKTNKELQAEIDEIKVMAASSEERAVKAEKALEAKEDKRAFEVYIERIDGTNKFLLVIPSLNYSAQLYKRDADTFIATKPWVHSQEETNSNEAVQAIIARKHSNDLLATQKPVAQQGDVPSAS